VPWRCDYICQVFPVTPASSHCPAVDERVAVSFNEYLKKTAPFISPFGVTVPLTQSTPISTMISFFIFLLERQTVRVLIVAFFYFTVPFDEESSKWKFSESKQ